MKKSSLKFVFVMLTITFALYGQTNKKVSVNFDQSFSLEDTGIFFKGNNVQEISYRGKAVKSNSENTGEPNIPWITVNIAVPDGAVYIEANLIENRSLTYENVLIEAVQTIIPVSYNKNVPYIEPDYSTLKNNLYPQSKVKFAGVSELSCYTIFNFLISPFEYDIKTKDLIIVNDLTLDITYSVENDISNVKKWDDGEFYQIVKDMVINKNEVKLPVKRLKSKEDVDHLIITDRGLNSTFQTLADHRTQNGLTSEIIETSWLYSNYPGATNQIKIKNCIKDYYENKGLKWVVLGGDDTIVPDQNVYSSVNGIETEDYTIPCDMFYACFDGQFDWNATVDDKIGNINDNVDMAPEVFIGRIPVRTSDEAAAYITKLIDYENNPPIDIADKFLMTGCLLWDMAGLVSDGEAKNEKMWDNYISGNWEGTKYRLYDTNSDFLGGSSYDLTSSNLQDQIDAGYGFVHMATHGNQTVWGMESGGGYFTGHALDQLNAKLGIIVTIACITNAFDCDLTANSGNCNGGPYLNEPCLSEGFIRNPNGGAVGYLGSSRYGWGYGGGTDEHGPSFRYNDEFFYKLFTGEGQTEDTSKRFGAVAAMAKMEFINSSASNGAYRWIMYSLNTSGDPALKVMTGADLASPSNFAVSTANNVLTISWDSVSNANSYLIYSSNDPNQSFRYLCTTESNTWNTPIGTDTKKFYYIISSTEAVK